MPSPKLLPFALAACASLLASCASTPMIESDPSRPQGPVMIATWPFGKLAVDAAAESLAAGGSGLDGIEAGIRLIESLGSDGSVGLAGRPNAAGYPQLDACIMDGPSRGAGSVGGMEGIVHPITAARRVMDSSRHVMLVGEGARWFALEHGLETVDVSDLEAKKTAWVKRERDPEEPAEKGHDTITLLMLDGNGDLYGGCSTSGAGGKLPGRVGDSPILGAGLFVDNEVGAAGATGVGENVMRYSATTVIVEMMRQGMTPQEACEAMVHRIAAVDPLGYELDVCFIAMDKQGRWGAAASNQRFPFAVGEAGQSRVVHVEAVPQR